MSVVLTNICMQFPGTRALDDVCLELKQGEVHSIIGENGAGKSTLLAVLSGGLSPTGGHVEIEGRRVVFTNAASALAHGIALVSQEGSLVPHLSAAENILLGREPHIAGVLRPQRLLASAQDLVNQWFDHSGIDLQAEVQSLPFAEQKLVEILRALNSAARILILDEPTAALPAREKSQLWDLIKRLAHRGVGIVYVSHLLGEVSALSDRISVLRDGRLIAQTTPGESDEAQLVGMMLGRHQTASKQKVVSPDIGTQAAVLSVQDWKGRGFSVPSLTLHRGEIMGLIGLTHAGHREFAVSLYEAGLAVGGCLYIDGKVTRQSSTQNSSRSGIALVPDHRMVNSLISGWSVKENISLAHVDRATVMQSVISGSVESRLAKEAMHRLRVKAYAPSQLIDELSGGNKQKVSIGKWLFAEGGRSRYRVLIFIEPTEGVDIGAKAEIHRLIRDLADDGLGIIVVSSDLLEVQSLCDRVWAFRQGHQSESLVSTEFTESRFIEAISPGATPT